MPYYNNNNLSNKVLNEYMDKEDGVNGNEESEE